MIIQPRIRGFICTAAHPIGCAKAVQTQINYIKSQSLINGPKNVLIIGASTGYGLASRITATFAAKAKTIGVFFERAADEKRTASPGWYNTAAFERYAHQEGYYAKSINGDAFSDEVKSKVADLIRADLNSIDLVIYSVASPRRTHPKTGQTYSSVLKPIGHPFTGKSVDAFQRVIKEVTISPATAEEVDNTIAVMGGEDWEMWIDFLAEENLLAKEVITVAYSYLGPALTHEIYKEGTIGKAKEHLKKTADALSQKLKVLQGKAFVSVNKAVVTQASAAIPVVPLYISLLFKVMKEKGTHEDCIQQTYRLFKDFLYSGKPILVDKEGYIRIDELEMDPEIQKRIAELWPLISSENVSEISDINGYAEDFYRLFGFNFAEVNYQTDVDPHVTIESLV